MLSLFAGRLIQLQGMESGNYRTLALQERDKTILLPAMRGSITGANGQVPALTGAQQAAAQSAISVGAAPVTSSTPLQIARVITDISHATFASGMHAAFLVAAAVALAGAVVGLLTRSGDGAAGGRAGR